MRWQMPRRVFVIGMLGLIGCTRRNTSEAKGLAKPLVRDDLYQCEGCEGALEVDPASLHSDAQIATAQEPGDRMQIAGTVFAADGKTPAPDVVIYAYQTNAQGLYAGGTPETEASRRHGRLRAWVRTGDDGMYRFDTIKPAPYPDDTIPAHIHFTVLERAKRPYWIDDIVFAGEFGVTNAYRQSMTNKGGDGIVKLTRAEGGLWLAKRDIVLEQHPRLKVN